MQLFCFSIIMINGKEWGALPYGWYVVFGTMDSQGFAIIGALAVILTLISIFWQRNYLQPLSLLIMWCSLGAFYWQLTDYSKHAVFRGGPALVTALIFLAVTVAVLNTRLSWKNF